MDRPRPRSRRASHWRSQRRECLNRQPDQARRFGRNRSIGPERTRRRSSSPAPADHCCPDCCRRRSRAGRAPAVSIFRPRSKRVGSLPFRMALWQRLRLRDSTWRLARSLKSPAAGSTRLCGIARAVLRLNPQSLLSQSCTRSAARNRLLQRTSSGFRLAFPTTTRAKTAGLCTRAAFLSGPQRFENPRELILPA